MSCLFGNPKISEDIRISFDVSRYPLVSRILTGDPEPRSGYVNDTVNVMLGHTRPTLQMLIINSRGKPCRRHRFGVPMIAQMNLFRVPMIDHRKQFGGEMIALLTGTFFR